MVLNWKELINYTQQASYLKEQVKTSFGFRDSKFPCIFLGPNDSDNTIRLKVAAYGRHAMNLNSFCVFSMTSVISKTFENSQLFLENFALEYIK